MGHYPLDHPLRQIYRLLAAGAGFFLVLAGIVGLASTWGEPFAHRGAHWAVGMRMNPAGAWLSTVLGVAIIAVAARGGNLHHRVSPVLGWAVIAVAMASMAFLQTGANVLNMSMSNVIVWSLLGLVVLTAGLYGQVRGRDR